MRLKNAIHNTFFILLQQIVTAVYGLVIPSLIIKTYGSSVNGVISSITQFLSYITLLEAGVGSVICAALYKPLAENNMQRVSGVVKATENFFHKLAKIFIIYLLVIALVYPYFVKEQFSCLFTSSLVFIISASILAQYYFGITYQLLLQSDQKVWVIALLQIISTIATFIITVICIRLGTNIHVLKLVTTTVYIFRPIILNLYVKRNYKFSKNIDPDNDALSQRWDGLAHHIAYIIHYNTDITVLTVFSNVLEVSVYAVYYNVISNIYKIISSFKRGLNASVGNMIANSEMIRVNKTLNEFETLNFMLINIFYSCIIVLVVPFVEIYTKGVIDVNYNRPIFAVVLSLAEAAYSIRDPYDMIIFAAGHFKQTKVGAYVEAVINIGCSLILVNFIGIEGVAIGTLIAMLFRAFQYVDYLSKNILYRSKRIFFKKFVMNICLGIAIVRCISRVSLQINTYLEWLSYAIIVFAIVLVGNISVNFVFYKNEMLGLYNYAFKRMRKE